jgi:hypothetical protein
MDLWTLARESSDAVVFSTLFSPRCIDRLLAEGGALDEAVAFCKGLGVTKVYLESFRHGRFSDADRLRSVRDRFEREGFAVAGGVTTTGLGNVSTGWDMACCFTDPATRETLQQAFEHAAGCFDEVMIDDFYFTDCRCDACAAARGDRDWGAYRRDLLVRLAVERICAPARRVNPNVRITLKYPQWYDLWHVRGYDPGRQIDLFDRVWAGTETRTPDRPPDHLPVVPQYEAWVVLRWLIAVAGPKCGGGWFDTFCTDPTTYVEQARQTILAGAREAVLFANRSLRRDTGPACCEAFSAELPGLLDLARALAGKTPVGIAAPKPAGSEGGDDRYAFDYLGMLALPLDPTPRLTPDAPGAIVSEHLFAQDDAADVLGELARRGAPLLATASGADRLAREAPGIEPTDVLPRRANEREAFELSVDRLDAVRRAMLAPLGGSLSAPAGVAVYPFAGGPVVIESFRDDPVDVRIAWRGLAGRVALTLPVQATCRASRAGDACELTLAPRSLAVLE